MATSTQQHSGSDTTPRAGSPLPAIATKAKRSPKSFLESSIGDFWDLVALLASAGNWLITGFRDSLLPQKPARHLRQDASGCAAPGLGIECRTPRTRKPSSGGSGPCGAAAGLAVTRCAVIAMDRARSHPSTSLLSFDSDASTIGNCGDL